MDGVWYMKMEWLRLFKGECVEGEKSGLDRVFGEFF